MKDMFTSDNTLSPPTQNIISKIQTSLARSCLDESPSTSCLGGLPEGYLTRRLSSMMVELA